MSIAGIILAAGASTRFEQPKQLVDWNGVPLLAHLADQALAAGLEPAVVVLGSQAERIHPTLSGRPVQARMNWRWEEGLSTSVQTGLAALPPETEAAVLMQCDQPLLTAGLLQALVTRFRETGAPIVYPTFEGKRGTPTLFARRLFPELAAVSGDVGGRPVIARHAGEAATVAVDHPDVLADVDTPADYQRLLRSSARPAMPNLGTITHLIIDMDGVLWRGHEPTAGLAPFFAALRERQIGFTLATNNSSRLPEQYAAKLAGFGVQVPSECILTSAQVAAAYLAEQAPAGSRVYAVGGEGVMQALTGCGFVLAEDRVDYVVVGWDRHLTWNKMATAALRIHEGATFVGTNPDASYPTAEGPVPGNGAQLALLERATGVAPVVTGKPEAWMYEEAMRRMGARPETTAVIGDRLDTDIAGGVGLGLTTILVLSGITTEATLTNSPIKPDLVYEDIRALTQEWAGDAI